MHHPTTITLTAERRIELEHVTQHAYLAQVRMPDGQEAQALALVTECNIGFAPTGAAVYIGDGPAERFEPCTPDHGQSVMDSLLKDWSLTRLFRDDRGGPHSSVYTREQGCTCGDCIEGVPHEPDFGMMENDLNPDFEHGPLDPNWD